MGPSHFYFKGVGLAVRSGRGDGEQVLVANGLGDLGEGPVKFLISLGEISSPSGGLDHSAQCLIGLRKARCDVSLILPFLAREFSAFCRLSDVLGDGDGVNFHAG